MSKTFRNLNDLFKHIQKDLQSSMNDVGKTVSNKTKKNIDEEVYMDDPAVYERTYQLRDSIKNFPAKVEGNEIIVEVDHDTDLIISIPEHYQHGSPDYEPNDISDFIDVIIHEGLSGNRFGNGFWRDKRQYFKATVDELIRTGEHIKALRDSMKRKGYDVR